MADERIVDGFKFHDDADVALAKEEIERIRYIADRMNMNNAQGVLAVYNKLISSGIFVTPIGQEYLRTLQSYLYKSTEVDDAEIREIPIGISYSDAINKRRKDRDDSLRNRRSDRNLIKTFRKEYLISLFANIVLVIAVIAMFVIALKSDTPNMINYRTAIVNQYADWQQDLDNREEVIREKELEMNKNNQ